MPIPIVYRKSGEAPLINFDFVDVATKTGYINFYGLYTNEGTLLVPSQTESDISYTAWTTDQNPGNAINYDLSFITHADLNGDSFVTLTVELLGTVPATPTQIYVKVRLYHVNQSAVATAISSQITSSILSYTGGSISRRVTIKINIDSEHFAPGEKLRLEIVPYYLEGSGTPTGRLYHDPASRSTVSNEFYTGTAPRSDIVMAVPFKVDL